jgi:acetoin:2,6-dichlorophenolindophenol oxidoreductase subunit alpha
VDDKTRLELYRIMVLSRTYEEAILREYHADKKPAFDIGAGLVPGEMHLSAGQEPAAAGVCALAARRRGHRDPPPPPHRDRPWG